MKLPFIKAERTTRTVVSLVDAAGETLTIPLGALRQIVADTPEFTDMAQATFTIKRGFRSSPYGTEHMPALRSLVIEETR